MYLVLYCSPEVRSLLKCYIHSNCVWPLCVESICYRATIN